MDFHSLSRKELQAICKKNKIPANMTNVAMADALKALEKVEGLDELINQSQSPKSPGKIITGSPENPRTVNRTSTRRKPIKEEPQSSQSIACSSRRITRITIAEESDKENKHVNLLETPAMPASRRRAPATSARRKMEAHVTEDGENGKLLGQEKSDVTETPMAQTGRRRAPVRENSVQRVYSTRRSMRLLEKNMEDLSLKEKESVEPVQIDDHSKETEKIQEKKGVSGADLKTILKESFEKSDAKENNSSDCGVDNHMAEVEVGLEKSDTIAVLDAKDETHDEEIDEKGSDNVPGSEDLSDEMVSEGLLAVKVCENISEEILNHVVPGEFAFPQIIDNLVSGEDSTMPNPSTQSHSDDQDENSKSEFQNLVCGDDSDMNVAEEDHHINNDHLQSKFASKEEEADESSFEFQGSKSDTEADQKDLEAFVLAEERMDCSEYMESKLVTDSIAAATLPGDKNIDNDLGSDEPVTDQSKIEAAIESAEQKINIGDNILAAPHFVEEPMVEMEKYNAESLIDVDVTEAEGFAMAHSKSGRQMSLICPLVSDGSAVGDMLLSTLKAEPLSEDKTSSYVQDPVPKMQEYGHSENLLDIFVMQAEEFPMATYEFPPTLGNTPTSVKQRSPFQPVVSGGKIADDLAFSPLAADSLPGQFPHPNHLTPRKSTSKKQTTIQKVTQVQDNKENINSRGRKVEPQKVKVKKNMNIIDEEALNETSLRQLSKMLKEKLQITKNMKNDEDENITKLQAGKTRPALQSLPENRMAGGEAEN